jgi:hypothetical protein
MSEAASRQVSPALEKAYQFLAWLIPTLDKFPRRQKFLLGDRIESTALDVLEGIGRGGLHVQPRPAARSS